MQLFFRLLGSSAVIGLVAGLAFGCADPESQLSGADRGDAMMLTDGMPVGGGGGANGGNGASGGSGGSGGGGSMSDAAVSDGAAIDATTGDSSMPGLDGSSTDGSSMDAAPNDSSTGAFALPPANGSFDYQLGGGYAPLAGVVTVSRDRTDDIAAGLYNICYVNGFQVQPGEEGSWDADLILRDENGDPVIDEDWEEALLDVGTADKRTRIATKINGFIDGCASKGFDAIEIDNLDTYSRSDGRLNEDHAVATMALLSAHAHAKGLAIAQKNSTELMARRAEMNTDFAVAEECSRYDECGDYVDAYGPNVLMIEYRDNDFAEGCAAYGDTHAIVRRDVDVTTPDSGGYVFDGC